jgi:hypothetical protein
MQVRVLVRFAAISVALFLGLASHASAATITATYTGTVKNALDLTGVFGAPGGDLAGAAYNLVYTIDDAVGSYSTFNGTISDPLLSGDSILGGVTAVLTINGHDLVYAGGSPNGSYDIAAHKPGSATLVHQASSMTASILASVQMTNPDPGFPTSVYTALTLSSCPAGSCVAGFFFSVPGGGGGSLNFGSLTVAATPIPAALLLLVSALGGLGVVSWRRRKQQAA